MLKLTKALFSGVVVCVLVLLATGHRAHAQTGSQYSAGGEADGLRATVTVNNFLVVSQLADVGIPTASTTVDSLGDSTGYASYPYPGATVVSAEGLVESGGGPQLPPYPFYVESAWPGTPKASNSAGPYTIGSTSTANETNASATSSAAIGQLTTGLVTTTSKSGFDDAAQTLTAISQSAVDSVDLGVLRIGKVTAGAEVIAGPKGTPKATSTFHAEGITIDGITVGLDTQGLVLGGSSAPLPPDSSLSHALAQSGISVHYVAGYNSGGEVVSPGLRIDSTQNLPSGATAVISYFFGEAAAHAQLITQGAPAAVSAIVPMPPPSGSSGQVAPVAGGVAGAPSTPGSLATAGPQGQTIVGAQETSPAGEQGATVTGNPQVITSREPATFSSTGFYAILVLAAVAALGGAQLIRLFAVRQSWGR